MISLNKVKQFYSNQSPTFQTVALTTSALIALVVVNSAAKKLFKTNKTHVQNSNSISDAVKDTKLFGNPFHENGFEISNKETILDEINQSIGCDSNPDLEIILAEATLKTNVSLITSIASFFGRFGHIAVRYRLPKGNSTLFRENKDNTTDDIVMNIVGLSDRSMVNFLDANEYFFGINKFTSSNEQGGIYNRHFYGLRIEKLNEDNDYLLKTLHSYYVALEQQSNSSIKIGKFRLVGGRIASLLTYIPFIHDFISSQSGLRNGNNININSQSLGKEGNCAIHTSKGLEFAGLLARTRIFPKAILVDMFEREMIHNPDNVHLIEYKEVDNKDINECYKLYPNYTSATSIVNPIAILRSWRYYNLSKMCDATVFVKKIMKKNSVETDDNNVNKYDYKAIVEKNVKISRPSVSFFIRNTNSFSAMFAVFYLLFLKKKPESVVASNFYDMLNAKVFEYRPWLAAMIVIVHYWIY